MSPLSEGRLGAHIAQGGGGLLFNGMMAVSPAGGAATMTRSGVTATLRTGVGRAGFGAAETTGSRFAGLSSAERRVILEGKLEANALRRLDELQRATPGAHFVERHGSQLTLASQLDRVAMGVNPTTGLVQRTPVSATRFFNATDQLSAISRAEQIFANTGNPALARQPIGFGRTIGEGYNRSLGYGTQTSAQVFVNAQGKAVTAFPLYGF